MHSTAPSGKPPCRRGLTDDSLTADAHFGARLGAFF